MSPISIRIVCNIWLRYDGRVERKRGYKHTDSWHEWEQDNFYGSSATKRIVIKEPSLVPHTRTKCCVEIKTGYIHVANSMHQLRPHSETEMLLKSKTVIVLIILKHAKVDCRPQLVTPVTTLTV